LRKKAEGAPPEEAEAILDEARILDARAVSMEKGVENGPSISKLPGASGSADEKPDYNCIVPDGRYGKCIKTNEKCPRGPTFFSETCNTDLNPQHAQMRCCPNNSL
jgi:hypothetical protein